MEGTTQDTSVLQKRVGELEDEVKSFGQQRAYFMDIYKRKEEEAGKLSEELKNVKHLKMRLESELKGIRDQVADMKTEHMITCLGKDEDIERLKFMHQDELSSLNVSLQDLLNENSSKQDLEVKVDKLITVNKNLNEELKVVKTALQGRMQRDHDLGRTFKDNSPVMRTLPVGKPHECTSAACGKEKKDLHMQLDHAHQTLQKYADKQADENVGNKKTKDLFEVVDHEEKLKELENELSTEKASRRDLEMYVAVLAKQKDVFHAEADGIRKELRESLALLEKERREHVNLKLTWQMANDQFLEAQRLLMIDMKRLESVLSVEQQRRVAELQQVDAEREAQQQKIDDLERQKQEQIEKIEAQGDSLLDLPGGMKSSSSHTSLSSTDVYTEFESAEPIHMTFNENSSSPAGSVGLPAHALDTTDSTPLSPPSININTTVLTDDMTTALVAPQAEDVENKRVLEQLRQNTPDRSATNAAGTRVVSEKNWIKLQEELQQSRAKLGRPCEVCKNYESDLQAEQKRVQLLDSQLTKSRQNVMLQKKTVAELEGNIAVLGEHCKKQAAELNTLLHSTDEKVFGLRATLEEATQEFGARISSLVNEREDVQKQLKEIERENDSLVDIHSRTSQQMLEEQFVEPTDLPSAVKLLTDFQQRIIAAKTAQEHTEAKMRERVTMLKDQAMAEQYQWKGKEGILTQELADLHEKNVRLESIQSELDREGKLRRTLEERLEVAVGLTSTTSVTADQLKTHVQALLAELSEAKAEKQQLIDRYKTLQAELSNSELVQKDFVKLSQQLQVQLEKIRQAETEVRWEYEVDVSKCNNCNIELHSNRDKHHCLHCGKIHCHDCTSKLVKAGPSRRPTRVCDVCHTILESDATPYFSTDSKPSS